ncbi:lysosomal-trafficking regulator isoform X2 [Bradysia coprophila]|uniref:lysosomal-trafficking regulator isoform X2 n=1 Tax=Bradysia coprophila TaxID=38358 RepID=UPI00187DB5F8|nr:lysosomal-trafficking regulator isoform X2 [Bradysia coprophila]
MEGDTCCDLIKFWTKFNAVEDSSSKEKWLELFLFAFNQLSESTNYDHLHKHCSISSSAASKLTSYMLQAVYDIICASLKEVTDDLDVPKKNGDDKRDITTIVALREFIIHGIGGRILEAFQSLDTKKIICARELTSLLVNLFPTHPWTLSHPEYKTKCVVDNLWMLRNVLESIENLKLPKRPTEKRGSNDSIFTENSSRIQYSLSASEDELFNGIAVWNDPELYHSPEFLEWQSTNYSCDYIASIIFNLLMKLTVEESILSVDKKSVCVQSLNFSVECYCTIAKNDAFQCENREPLRSKALTLLLMCMKNIMVNAKRFEDHIKVLSLFEKLYGSIGLSDGDCMSAIQSEHETGFIYFTCLILHKMRKHPSMIGVNMFNVLATRIDCILNIVKVYFGTGMPGNCGNLSKLINVLCKTIFDIRNHDLPASEKVKKKSNKKRKKGKKSACFHHHDSTSQFGCVSESLLLQIMQYASTANLVTTFQFFQRNNICCCNANLSTFALIVDNARSKSIQKSALSFLKNNFLKIFYCNTECAMCEVQKRKTNFECNLIALYKQWFHELRPSFELTTFMNHIAKISKYLTFDVSSQFIVEIVLPPFRIEKGRYIEATKTAVGQEIIESCLNTFLCFLKDVRLIKGFFNTENVQHMEDLLFFPEFVSLTCCLLKIGIENLSFLGEDASEQAILSGKLRSMQSTAIISVSNRLILVFDEIERDRSIGLKVTDSDVQKTLDTYTNQSIIVSPLKDLLHLAVVYWNLILQLLRTNEQIKNVIHETIVIDPGDLQNIVFNSFSCYLHSKQLSGGSVLNDRLIEDIEEWLLANDGYDAAVSDNDAVIVNDSLDSLIPSDVRMGILDIQYDIEYTNLVDSFYTTGATINNRSHTEFANEDSFMDSLIVNECNSVDDVKATVEAEHIIVTGVKKITNFLTNNVFDHFFVNGNTSEVSSDDDVKQVNGEADSSNYVKDYDTVEVTLLFLQLFEITAGVMILSNLERSSSAIRELKYLLIEYCNTTTASQPENGTKLIGALLALLKVAEMKYQCCFTANCHHSLPPSERALQNLVNTNENSEAYCCSSKNRANEEDVYSSDIEGSDDESTSSDIYTTADEGYDGDAEVIQDTDPETSNRNYKSSRYGSHTVHDGLCRVVIDILIDLSKRCLQEPLFWPKHLIQIASRLGTIRESIGGSLYLIRGFSKILASNDSRLRELQKSILELITEINTAETLSAYLNILSGDNAPVDLLLPRLVYLGKAAYQVQPTCAFQFPSINDESIKSSCEPLILKDIKQIHDYHEVHKQTTAFTKASYVIPLNCLNFSPWNSDGFTVTTWINMAPRYGKHKVRSNSSSDEEDPFREIVEEKSKLEKLHLLSVGSNKLLFTVYVSPTDSSTVFLQLSKPSAQYAERKIPKLTRSSTEVMPDPVPPRKKSPCPCTSQQRRRKSSRAISPIQDELESKPSQSAQREYVKNGNGKQGDETLGLNVLSSTYHAVKSTHIAIRNSLSQFNLFSSTSPEEYFTSQLPLEVKGLKLAHNQWKHLSFSVLFTGSEMKVRIMVDGSFQRDLSIPCSHQVKNDKFQVLCVGSKLTSPKLVEYINNDTTKPKQPEVVYSLSNVHLFRTCILEADVLGSLVALGADYMSLTQCQIGNVLPNFGFLSSMTSLSGNVDFTRAMTILKDNLTVVFDSMDANIVSGFTNRASNSLSGGETMGMITFGSGANCLQIPSFQTATLLCGGMATLLFLFAKVVELSDSEFIQSSALTFLLKIAHSNPHLYTEFIRKDYTSLIGPVIHSTGCIKGINLLNSILETACDKPVLTKRSDGFHVVATANANIVHPNLLMSIIHRYSDWHVPKSHDSTILATLLETFQALVREKHPRQAQNIHCLSKAGLIPALLNFCKVHLICVTEPAYLSRQAADSIVNLMSIFAGSPPNPSLLDDIIKVLLLLHRPSESFITHDRSKFYFLVSSMVMVKQKRISLPMSTRKLSINIRRERKNTVPMRKSPTKAPTMRSVSMDHSLDRSGSSINQSVDRLPSTNSDARECTRRENEATVENGTAKENEAPVENGTHLNNSGYPTADGLDAIVSYSAADRRMKKLLKPGQPPALLLNSQFKKRSFIKKNKMGKRSPSSLSSRTTTDSETEKDARGKGTVAESGVEDDMQLVKDYEVIAIEDVRNLEEKTNFKFQRQDLPFENTQYGITQLQNGLFNLLKDFILILPDASIQEVLSHYVTVDIILIMANHQDPGVRSSIVKLLSNICNRLDESVHNNCTKSYHWHHLANQISLHKADVNLVTNIVQWVTSRGLTLSLDQLVADNSARIEEKCGLYSLIAILPQCIHDLNLTQNVFTFMDKLYAHEAPNMRRFMIDIGILPSVIKAVTKFFSAWGTTNPRVLGSIESLMGTISYKSLASNGNISVVWDLLNGLSFMEESETPTVQRCLRSTQAVILSKLLESFFPTDRLPTSGKFKFNASDVNLTECLLSLSEKKIRFELLVNRALQFITHMDSSYIQTDEEIRLIESMVILSVSGCPHGNNIIGWGLCPSRPLPLKIFIIRKLWQHSRSNVLPTLACDGKVVKTMAHKFMQTDGPILSADDLEILTNVCNAMGISAATASNLSQMLEKMEFARNSSIKDQAPSIERTVFKFETIVQHCIDSAMKITRDVVEIQNMERRVLMNAMRRCDESGLSREWNKIIERMTHEGAPWWNEEKYPTSFEMDQTEGPCRARIRLKRCHLNIGRKFLVSDDKPASGQDNRNAPLSYLGKCLVQRPHYSLSDQVIYTFPCKHLPVDSEVDGEMVVTESHVIFLANELDKAPIIIDVSQVAEIWLRRYQHQEIGMEFFLETNISKFFIFAHTNDRDIIKNYFADKVVQCPGASKLAIVTQQWKERQLTNWEYLIALNQISGRTFQDLMQYPVFPWILADYRSATLDLTSQKSFRNLGKPIAVQHPENEAHYISNYNYLEQARMASSATGLNQFLPYHYSSHYSNSGVVLHFMVRVPPFTHFFLHYQDNNFDLPDRTFHSVDTTWRLASKESPTDVKELIPEFFCFPEMFENFERLNFGVRQSGEPVYDVILPPWANQSSRLFVLIHRQALECENVRQNLHRWVDLVFGYKQMGQDAVDAINVFHPATYISFSMSGVSDPVEKTALETMVRTYGQMPRQLLTTPHPSSSLLKSPRPSIRLHNFPVKGLSWGTFTGSPELSEPEMVRFYEQYDLEFSSLVSLVDTNVLYGLADRCNIMQGNESDTINLISWNGGDGIIGIRPLCDESSATKPLIRECNYDRVSCCGTDPQSNQLWLGHKSGRISVYQCLSSSHSKLNKSRLLNSSISRLSYNSVFQKMSSKGGKTESIVDADSVCHLLLHSIEIANLPELQNESANKWKEVVVLIKHTNEVTQITISNQFKVVVSVAKDGLAAIWDLNNLQFIRSIAPPSICKAPIYLTAVSPTLGDIITIHIIDTNAPNASDDDPDATNECLEATETIADDFVTVPTEMNGKSLMRLHTINAKYITHISITEPIKCVSYSFIKEGTGINAIATGFDGGIVRLWSSWDLTLIKEINVGQGNVLSLCYSTYQHLVVLTSQNIIQVWESHGLPGNMPKLPQLFFHKRN